MQFDFPTTLNMQIRTFYGSKSIGVFLLSDSGQHNVIWTLHRPRRYIKVKGMFIVWYQVWRRISRLYMFYLSQVKHLRVKFLAQRHNIETMSQDWEGRNSRLIDWYWWRLILDNIDWYWLIDIVHNFSFFFGRYVLSSSGTTCALTVG